ncbi:MAG: hypothetical protein A2144_12575 [Chloroflexi bacterium RBG_16_50_9]|nr:MAG: hypothetical protein A2144_12575 [Chloroflexi bacterium RBG_16_50_9]
MPKEGYFGIALGIAGFAMTVIQMIYPQIPASIGWSIVAVLLLLSVVFVIKGILIGREARKKDRESKPRDGWPRAW